MTISLPKTMHSVLMLIVLSGLVACSTDSNTDATSSSNTPPLDGQSTPSPAASGGIASSCLPEGDADLQIDELRDTLPCVASLFQWPANMVPDDAMLERSIQKAPDGGEARYERGYEFGVVSGLNTCSWYITWIEARQAGDAELESEALAYMTDVIPHYSTQVPGFSSTALDPSVTRWHEDVADKASLGDPTLVQEAVRDCPSFTSGDS